MEKCEICGKSENVFHVTMGGGVTHIFDSQECAMRALAPRCANCGIRLTEQRVEVNGEVFCGAQCAGNARGEELNSKKVHSPSGETATAEATFEIERQILSPRAA